MDVVKDKIKIAIIKENIVFKILEIKKEDIEKINFLFLNENVVIRILSDKESKLCFEGAEFYNNSYRIKKPSEDFVWNDNMWIPEILPNQSSAMVWCNYKKQWREA